MKGVVIFLTLFLILLSSGIEQVYASTAPSSVVHRTLTSPNPQPGGEFGIQVAASGNIVVIGAPYETASGVQYAGRAYAFSAKTGALISDLVSPNAQTEGEFGYSVAVSGSTVVVGAWGESVSGYSEAGRAYTFNATTGAMINTLTSPNLQYEGLFGVSVAVSGSIVVVGAPAESASGHVYAGNAYTFDALTGKPIRELSSPNAQYGGRFGYSVAVIGSTVVVGAWGESVSGYSSAGRAYTFNAKTGALISSFSSPNVQADGGFGFSVAIGGGAAVVGAPLEAISRHTEAGRAYTFNATTGALVSTLVSPSGHRYGHGEFGWSVAVSGKTVVVGALREKASDYGKAGRVFTYNAKTGALIDTLTSPNPSRWGLFRASVAATAQMAVVGAPFESPSGYVSAGSAYIFWTT